MFDFRSMLRIGLVVALVALVGCGGGAGDETEPAADASTEEQSIAELMAAAVAGLPPELQVAAQPWHGDLDEMVERKVIRLLTVYSRGFYFLDGPEQRGVTWEASRGLEELVNERFQTGTVPVSVVVAPVPRAALLPALAAGYGDIAAANLTVTPEREALVDFAAPLMSDVSEIVVTGPSAPEIASLEDLGGMELLVRFGSSYHESLLAFNARQEAAGLPPAELVPAPEHLEDDDLLEMVNAGLLPLVLIDTHKAEFWAQVFDGIELRPDLTLRTGATMAWAVRKDTPQLRALVDDLSDDYRQGTLLGNILLNRYLRDTAWVENSTDAAARERYGQTIQFFRRYGDEYAFDWLMLTALGYQESRLDQGARSGAGAVGIMQILPSTAADPNVGIPDVLTAENNIHAGTKYLRFLRSRYFDDPAVDVFNQTLFTFASYNAGPARVAGLRDQARAAGLDPNQWFGHVETIAAREIGRETVQYVSNVFKYFLAYQLLERQQRRAQEGDAAPPGP